MATQYGFDGKVAFVTGSGSGSGSGRVTALAFLREGACVAVVGIDHDNVDETARLNRAGGRPDIGDRLRRGRPHAPSGRDCVGGTWMCSDDAGFLVGGALVMDGGQTARSRKSESRNHLSANALIDGLTKRGE